MADFVNQYPNLYFAALPVAAFLCAVPHWYTINLAMKSKTNPPFDLGNPRRWVAGLHYRQAKGDKLSKVEKIVLQGQAAQQNGFEHLPIFAAALILGKLAGIEVSTMNNTALFYLATRVAFIYLYLTIPTGFKSLWRTFVFNAGYLSLVRIFFKAAFKQF